MIMTTHTTEPRMEQNLHMKRQVATRFGEQVNELYKSAEISGLAH
jgi:hypothetical protein